MKIIKEILEQIGVDLGLIISGLIGILADLKTIEGEKSTIKIVSYIFGGIGAAVYITPLFINVLESLHFIPRNPYGIGFAVGYIGIQSVRFMWSILKNKIKN